MIAINIWLPSPYSFPEKDKKKSPLFLSMPRLEIPTLIQKLYIDCKYNQRD